MYREFHQENKKNKVIKQAQEPIQVQDFPSEQKELYRHRLHHQMDRNIWNQLNNTKEELKKINRQTKINIHQMQEVPQEILNIKNYQQEIEETIPSWKPILFPVSTREAA